MMICHFILLYPSASDNVAVLDGVFFSRFLFQKGSPGTAEVVNRLFVE